MVKSKKKLLFVINHVFMPLKLPQKDDLDEENEQTLCKIVYETAQEFEDAVPAEERPRWNRLLKMLQEFMTAHRFLKLSKDDIIRSLKDAQSGDVLAFLIRAQNAGVIIRKGPESVVFEMFEVSPPNEAIMSAESRLNRSFPDQSVRIPTDVFEDIKFRTELAGFLAAMDTDILDSAPITVKAKSAVTEVRDTAHPRYITQLLTDILRGMGEVVEVPRIAKRVADDILWSNTYKPWRRSAIWLVLRVALQTTLVRRSSGQGRYKELIAFLHARILQLSLKLDLPNYFIACMQRKTARRLAKLGSIAPPFLLQSIQDATTMAQSLLQERWKAAQEAQATSLNSTWAPSVLDIAADTVLSLHNSKEYLLESLQGTHRKSASNTFTPNHLPRLFGAGNFANFSVQLLAIAFISDDRLTALADFEQAVLDNLSDWATENLFSDDSYLLIASCMERYSDAASKAYSSNPELLSIMILTLFKLWVELDRIAITQCPLLAKFSPEVPCTLLHPLLLRTSRTMEALDHVEKYLRGRYFRAVPGQSVFASTIDEASFAVQYFDQSGYHQVLKLRIEETARAQRLNKITELHALKARYYGLIKSAEDCEHEYVTEEDKKGRVRNLMSPQCRRCKLEKQALAMVIVVHEWPLPLDPEEAKAVVFELAPPLPFAMWRKVTYTLLREICIPAIADALKQPAYMQLNSCPTLMLFHHQIGQDPRVVLASISKSFGVSHYREQNVAGATEASVCVNHGLKWKLLDSSRCEWVTQRISKCSIEDHCILRLHPGRYQSLQYAVSGTSHTSNETMANQAACPTELTLHEFMAFTKIRSGPRLQWLNIMSELRSGSLNLQEEAVYSLISQAVWQMGPSALDGRREWHIEPTEWSFGETLLVELRDVLLRLKANWRNIIGLQVITTITSRLLASATDAVVIENGLKLLREVRDITYGWLNKLLEKLGDAETEDALQENRIRICEMAAICRGTYDIDVDKAWALFSDTEDVAIFVHCAILFNYHSPVQASNLDVRFRNLLVRDRRLCHVMEPLVIHCIAQSREGLDRAILRVWKFYRPYFPWKHLPMPNDRWVVTSTSPSGMQKSQAVHLDLLSSQLLVDGKPLGRLPQAILTHPTYIRIFGQRSLDVIPADMPGMDFETSSPIGFDLDDHGSGYQVFFALRNFISKDDPGQLVIRTQRDAEILELIPHDVFKNDLPAILVENQTHWLNVSTSKGQIEIRDLKSKWKSSKNNWRIQFCQDDHGSSFMELKNGTLIQKLIDPRSATMSMMAANLRPLEDPDYLIVTFSATSSRLVVSLPRLGLEFFLNDEKDPSLESANMPGMIIDANQSSETMIGLQSQLILRERVSSEPCLRQVIIPFTPDTHLTISSSIHHCSISLVTDDRPNVRYLIYMIDPMLGRLEGDGTMLSKLYKAYLHAITSHCLPDPLTGRTGTEEALEELRSAGVMSFQKLGDSERLMLQKINELTPQREYYPSHLKVMQVVGWSMPEICPFAQHHDFYALTNSIWRYAGLLEGLISSEDEARSMPSDQSSEHLLRRATRQNEHFYRSQADNSACAVPDTMHHSRGQSIHQTPEEVAVSNISAMTFNWESRLSTRTQLFNTFEKWVFATGCDEELSLAYSRDWFDRNMAKFFLSASNACRAATKAENRYQITFSFSAWAYTSADVRQLIPTIFTFATIPQLRAIQPPSWSMYDLSAGVAPAEDKISKMVIRWANTKLKSQWSKRKVAVFDQRYTREVTEMVKVLMDQWPCEAPIASTSGEEPFEIPKLEKDAATMFQSCLRNKDLFEYLQTVQGVLDRVKLSAQTPSVALYTPSFTDTPRRNALQSISLQQLVSERAAPRIPSPPVSLPSSLHSSKQEAPDTEKLKKLLREFRTSTFLSHQSTKPAAIQQKYAHDLETSLQSLEMESGTTGSQRGSSRSQVLDVIRWRGYQSHCKEHLQTTYGAVHESLLPSTEVEQVMFTAGLWPCLTTTSLLKALTIGSNGTLSPQWRKTLNSFARAILIFQQACRLTKHLNARHMEEFASELEKIVKEEENDNMQCSLRLVIQVDCNFLARKIQLDFIREMTTPSSQNNTVLQLNMGEGKSSVIVPIAAAALSDGKKLVRVVVLKPLAPAMFQLLVHRLGGLANRRIFYLPIARTPRLSLNQAEQVRKLFVLCTQVQGVLVVQPDHILSFKLMGLDRKFNTTLSSHSFDSIIANRILDSQRWLVSNSRDILDESDEILHVRYQLVYTIGEQRSLHASPDRWIIAQQILTLAKRHAKTIIQSYPDSIEVTHTSPGSYPRIRILHDNVATELIDLIGKDILDGALEFCSFSLFPPQLCSLALSYITTLKFASQDVHILEDYCRRSGMWNTILIIRGLLAHGILLFALKEKRWRVDYGPDPTRSMLAVPYRAKDVPSLRAEFSHPDVTILLTCLSYYWQGLSESQMEQCFTLLLKQDNPSLQYERWVLHGDNIPEQLKNLDGINIRDLDQRAAFHSVFHQNQAAVDFFLSHVVFPRDAKEFSKKMATSGWDLAERKAHVTTGFSGTNDGCYLLPTSIDQADPLSQSGTNAKVLTYLLKPENDHYYCTHQSGQPNSEQSLLRLLVKPKPEIRVLLDVGAQILQLSNEEVATEWLHLNSNPHILAAIFFGSDDEPYVRTRSGVVEPLVSSPFRQRLEKCLFYLDDAHTRGTDFKLPSGTRAAVTLGPKVTKDRLLQGCMRMRKLGHGHSVMFFAPPEVDHTIRAASGLRSNDTIEIKHVILWTMFESCLEILHRIPQWAEQGMDYQKREAAWMEFNHSPSSSTNCLEEAWIKDEARSLEDMYSHEKPGPTEAFSQKLQDYPDISTRYLKWAPTTFSDLRFQEEQEREVIYEVERERQLERPPRATPAVARVDSDVRTLVQKGEFDPTSTAFVQLFQPLDESDFEKDSWSSSYLYATKDFSITVRSSTQGNSSDYLRPVNWVLSAAQPSGTIFVVLSPHEVNDLLPDIRRSDKVHIHQYSPRVTHEMKSFENLAFHCIPPLPTSWTGVNPEITTLLNLWAGQLYLEDKGTYHHLCNFLGLYCWQPRESDVIQPDGFIKPEHRHNSNATISPFQSSPVIYLKRLFAIRRKGMDYAPTHMGKILRGRLLKDNDFPKSDAELTEFF